MDMDRHMLRHCILMDGDDGRAARQLYRWVGACALRTVAGMILLALVA